MIISIDVLVKELENIESEEDFKELCNPEEMLAW